MHFQLQEASFSYLSTRQGETPIPLQLVTARCPQFPQLRMWLDSVPIVLYGPAPSQLFLQQDQSDMVLQIPPNIHQNQNFIMYSEKWVVDTHSALSTRLQMRKPFFTRSRLLKCAGLLTGLGLYAFDEFNESKILSRNLRTIRCGLNILYQYKWRFDASCAEEVHEAIAKDIYETCIKNDGLYVKFGQGIAATDHLLPPAYFKWMSLLQDKAKAVSIDRVKSIIMEETGKELSDIFSYFNDVPVASASIAQVHDARLKSGEKVAVKVQKPNIKKQFKTDMLMHKLICHVLEYAFDLPLTQFQNSIEKNLAKEIDFNIEQENADTSRQALEIIRRKDVYIPRTYPQFTSSRLMVSEWIDGIKVTHLKEIQNLGFNTKDVMETVIGAFAEQIFITGFVHCDPHPGNIFVRRNPQNPKKFQVVLLDFGLCIQLENKFRQDYSKFWTALFLQDRRQMKEIIEGWGVSNLDMFASMQLMKPYQQDKPIHCHKPSAEEVMNLQMKMKHDIKTMMNQTHLFPQDLLFVNRNMNLVRSVNKKCGSLVNRINMMARYAQQGSQLKENIITKKHYSKKYTSGVMFELRLWVSSLMYNLLSLWLSWKGNQTVEEFLEQKEKEKFQDFYRSYGFRVPDEKTFDA